MCCHISRLATARRRVWISKCGAVTHVASPIPSHNSSCFLYSLTEQSKGGSFSTPTIRVDCFGINQAVGASHSAGCRRRSTRRGRNAGYELPYPLGRLCHGCPTLRPARALTLRIPVGHGPSLHRLRSRLRSLVRRLRRYYAHVRLLRVVHLWSSLTPSLRGPGDDTPGRPEDLPGPGI